MFGNAFVRFFDARKWPLFLLGAAAVAVSGNAVFDLLKRGVGDGTGGLLLILGMALVVLFGSAVGLAAWLGRPAAIVPPNRTRPDPRRGLILLVGLRDETCRAAIRHHAPALQRLWLVCSPQSHAVAARLSAGDELPAGVSTETVTAADVYDPRGAFDAVLGIAERLPDGWAPGEVIADFTGLTAAASVGVVLACLQTGLAIEYTPAEYDAEGRPLRPLPPQEVVFRERREGTSTGTGGASR